MEPLTRSGTSSKQPFAMKDRAAKRKASGGAGEPSVVRKSPKKKSQGWNTMSHLSLKRFADDDETLPAGARRDRVQHPDLVTAEPDPSGRALCKWCGDRISKDSLRLCLWLECHRGYRNACTLHYDCFWRHPETQKLERVEEIALKDGLDKDQITRIQTDFEAFLQNQQVKNTNRLP